MNEHVFDEDEALANGLVVEENPDDDGDIDEDPLEANQEFNPQKKYTKKELEEMADAMLRDDSNRELCKKCREKDPKSLPYGDETGEVEWQIQKGKDGLPLYDSEGNTLYVAFPELRCAQGHRWYKGEGLRRSLAGKDPILFETHLYNRKRREIHVKDGIPDPAFTMDRWGKRPTQGIYNRAHPQGRKINTEIQRKKNGASWYRRCYDKLNGTVEITSNGILTDQSRTNRADQKTRSKASARNGASLEVGQTWW